MGEILNVDSALKESTSLWWIKTNLPWIDSTTSDLGTPRMVRVKVHIEKDIFQVRRTSGADLRSLAVRINR